AATVPVLYDRAGNLVADNAYIFGYDGFNRLVQVNKRNAGQPLQQDPTSGSVFDGPAVGAWVAHYSYDALGRLCARQEPWDSTGATRRIETYVHDGVRRIHEEVADPTPGWTPPPAPPPAGGGTGGEGGGGEGGGTVLNQGGGGAGNSQGFGEGEIEDDPPPGVAPDPEPYANMVKRSAWQYIYTPRGTGILGGGGGGEVFEFVCRVRMHGGAVAGDDPEIERQYILQDAGGNVAAVVEVDAPNEPPANEPPAQAGGPSAQPPAARVITQYSFDPYGNLLDVDEPVYTLSGGGGTTGAAGSSVPRFSSAAADLRIGHKGLFADRLDRVGYPSTWGGPASGATHGAGAAGEAGQTGSTSGWTNPGQGITLAPGAVIVCHNLNRIYSPGLGRFMQSDPNGTGQPVLASAAMHGDNPGAMVGDLEEFACKTLYGDGMNIHSYLSGSPLMHADPLGLSTGGGWQENYDGVTLPLVGALDGTGLTGMLTDVLGMYQQIRHLQGVVDNVVQQATFAQEGMVDDVLDWNSSDDTFLERTAYGQSSGWSAPGSGGGGSGASMDDAPAGPAMAVLGGGGRSPVGGGRGRGTEDIARAEYGAVKVGRAVSGKRSDGLGGKVPRRFYDGEIGKTGSRKFMEVKSGTQSLTSMCADRLCAMPRSRRAARSRESSGSSTSDQVRRSIQM
ncbi:MAG: hypothetical protein ACKVS8_03590, partial [Phycisphaerales bacterium]